MAQTMVHVGNMAIANTHFPRKDRNKVIHVGPIGNGRPHRVKSYRALSTVSVTADGDSSDGIVGGGTSFALAR